MEKIKRNKNGHRLIILTCPVCGRAREVADYNIKRKKFTGLCQKCHIKRLIELRKGRPCPAISGKNNPMFGVHRFGRDNPNWKGGVSFESYPTDWTDDLRESIRKRDDYICKICGIHQDELRGWNEKLDVHHINYDKDNLNPDNLISLCRSCHTKTNYNREYWIKYFLGGKYE